MFGFKRKNNNNDTKKDIVETSFFNRLKTGLSKTREKLTNSIASVFTASEKIDNETLDEIEAILLSSDLGIETTTRIITELKEQIKKSDKCTSEDVFGTITKILQDILISVEQKLDINSVGKKPYIILTIGINGAGKTTTIGKLAKYWQAQGKSVMFAAGDTFRAAAVEQLEIWAEKNNIHMVGSKQGGDSASVIFDAIQSAKARNVDILIADTAGRLHTQTNLMQELEKIKRVIQKIEPEAPHEVLLVLDASIGQNALLQVREFNAAIGVSGIVMTKLDGTAKGGVLVAIANETKIPIRFIGFGEAIDALREFDAKDYVQALLAK